MCRNHSHIKADLVAIVTVNGIPHQVWNVLTEFTIEQPNGARLTQPAGSMCLTPCWIPEDYSALAPPLTVAPYEYTPRWADEVQ